ncbi:MAG: CotH kinase family protein [Candidatus Hatepunaea meridiana]|nr:CotH kinase family protein [Candidatus Hatepunaea meridiana]
MGFNAQSAVAQQVVINEIMSNNRTTITDEDGDYPDWIELYNTGPDRVSLRGYGLSDDPDEPFKWVFPNHTLIQEQFLLVFASGKNRRDWRYTFHTNFCIQSDGEELILTTPDGMTIDRLNPVAMEYDVSYGRIPDGGRNQFFFIEPTPNGSNGNEPPPDRAPSPIFSLSSGFYQQGRMLTVTCPDTSVTIYYTLDGSIPVDTSDVYSEPLRLDSTVVIRAICYSEDAYPSLPANSSFFIEYETELPVVSLITDPENLWDDETGIYIRGSNADPDPPYEGANFWQDWEIPAHIDFFELDRCIGFSQEVGIKIYGGVTRTKPMKSLRITAREWFGSNHFNYSLFPNLPIHSFKSFILRNSGNDWGKSMFRDPLMTGLVDGAGIAKQAYRPVVVFFNGVYWGIHNMRERLDEDFLAAHYNADKNSVDIIENHNQAKAGDMEAYSALIRYVRDHDLSEAIAYDSVNTMMDIENFICYQAAEIYFANIDWPRNNYRCWRSRQEGGCFQWILYDTDYGFFYSDSCDHNTIEWATSEARSYANLLFRNLLENEAFREKFIVRFCDLMNIQFRSNSVLIRIENLQEGISDEMPAHEDRWYPRHNWNEHIDRLQDFAQNRKVNVIGHLRERFDLGELAVLNIEQTDETCGRVRINRFTIDELPWNGEYFEDLSITLSAEPFTGYRFVSWEGGINTSINPLELEITENLTIRAHFEQVNGFEGTIVITEINYNSSNVFNPGDWIELYALSGNHNLSNWFIRDDNNQHVFVITDQVYLSEGDHLIIAEDIEAFHDLFPDANDVIGDLGFGLDSNGDQIRLYNAESRLVDSVAYLDSHPWPFQPDGNGPTLQLINTIYANELAHNWGVSLAQYGDPGEMNRSFGCDPEKNRETYPKEFSIIAYPNPFNSRMQVNYCLPEAGNVKLNIYDITGRLVMEFFNGHCQAGTHSTLLDGTHLASGIYLIRFEASGHVSYMKTALVK